MKISFELLTKGHVLKAIEEFLTKNPNHPKARTTFLKYKNHELPAKYILGLAYKIATGIELKKDEYSGGDQTSKILTELGFDIIKKNRMNEQKSNLLFTKKTKLLHLNPVEQKNALQKLLQKKFGIIETEKKFSWLKTPSIKNLPIEYRLIYKALKNYRGFDKFFKSNLHLLCDFYFHDYKLIIEYDENQHFTLPRKISLEQYPSNILTFFSKSDWINACNSIKAKDNSPPHRDEQRAFYDSVRDIEASKNGYTLLRIKHNDYDWTSKDSEKHVNQLFGNLKIRKVSDLTIGLISFIVDFDNERLAKNNLVDVIQIINENEDLDLIIFSGWTLFDLDDLKNLNSQISNRKSLIFFEVWKDNYLGEEVHKCYYIQDGKIHDDGIIQIFSSSKEISKNPDKLTVFFQEQFEEKRRFKVKNKILRWIVCGEINFLRNIQNQNNKVLFRLSEDRYLKSKFDKIFAETDIFINPTHTQMGNQGKMQKRREFLSQDGKIYCSVANLNLKKPLVKNSFSSLDSYKSLQYCFFDRKKIEGIVQGNSNKYLFKKYLIKNFFN